MFPSVGARARACACEWCNLSECGKFPPIYSIFCTPDVQGSVIWLWFRSEFDLSVFTFESFLMQLRHGINRVGL